MEMPGRRISSNSPAPPDLGAPAHRALLQDTTSHPVGSPVMSAPGTPQSLALPMNPPPTTHSRRSSFGSQVAPSIRRSVSPSPSMPLPAVMPSASPALSSSAMATRNTHLYANETFTSFFRRLTFAPDGSLLFTPAGQYKSLTTSQDRKDDEIVNTVYIYTRAGLNKPPVAHLPGHKKPSIAVKCSPVYYNIRLTSTETKEITIDTGNEEEIDPLPEPAVPQKTSMDPPPINAPSPSPSQAVPDLESGPTPVFSLPYRIIYGVATQDTVYVYDTQQQKPICVVSNLHHATFTDLCWSNDGQTLFMTSSDGFCSTLAFAAGELGSIYHQPGGSIRHTPTPISVAKANSAQSTPQATPTLASPHPMPSVPRTLSHNSAAAPPNPPASPFATATAVRPASPARSASASSIATQSSFAFPDQIMNNPTPSVSSMPSIAAAGSNTPSVPLFTPPQTPGVSMAAPSTTSTIPQIAGLKRNSNASEVSEEGNKEKKRRIAPTLVRDNSLPPPPPPRAPSDKS